MKRICLKLFSLQKFDKDRSFIKKQQAEEFCKKDVLKKFHKIHLKTPGLECLFNKVSGLRPATLLKNRLQHRCFHVNFVKFFLQNISWRLLLFVICLTEKTKEPKFLLLEKSTKLTILLSFHFEKTFYTLYCECMF